MHAQKYKNMNMDMDMNMNINQPNQHDHQASAICISPKLNLSQANNGSVDLNQWKVVTGICASVFHVVSPNMTHSINDKDIPQDTNNVQISPLAHGHIAAFASQFQETSVLSCSKEDILT
jgi:hypothetical protein